MPEPTISCEQEDAFTAFVDYREEEISASLSNVKTVDDVDELESSKPWLRKLLLTVPMLFAMFCF